MYTWENPDAEFDEPFVPYPDDHLGWGLEAGRLLDRGLPPLNTALMVLHDVAAELDGLGAGILAMKATAAAELVEQVYDAVVSVRADVMRGLGVLDPEATR